MRTPHPADRSELLIDIHELARRAGEQRELHRQVPAPAALGIELIGVPQGAPMDLDLSLESVVEGVYVSGSVTVPLHGECARCLTGIDSSGTFEVQELYFYPDREAEEEASRIVNDQIDLDTAVRDAIVLELPFAPLCRPDCRGLCQICGANLNEDPGHTHGEQFDARWEKLGGLLEEQD